ncbi:MAG: MarR family transcriptional regulator [bacterium]|nr:MarR family transcriptional regulator [bacterium]
MSRLYPRLSLENKKVTPSHVADRIGVTQAAVSKMVRRLQDLKLLRYDKMRGLRLSGTSEKVALEVIRRDRARNRGPTA